jgi:hypothetical protein
MRFRIYGSVLLPLLASLAAFAQTSTIVVNGKSGQAATIQQNGHTYVDVATLAQIANGSLSFKGKTLVLSIPGDSDGSATAAASPADDTTLSRAFMKAGIEEMGLLREWGASVAYAIQNGYPVQEQWAANLRGKAANGLQMASAAASSAGDKSALQLLNTEFDGVSRWSDRLVRESKNMDTAKYSMSPDSLRQEPESQKLITCWRFLGSMLGNGSFQDDDSCH